MSIFNKLLSSINNIDDDYDDDYDYDDYQDEVMDDDYQEKKSNKVSLFNNKSRKSSYDNNYDSYEEPARPSTPQGGGVCVMKPTNIDDGRSVCDTIRSNKTVILNVEGLDIEIAQRIIDFTSGSVYALEGSLQKISNSIFLLTPKNVNISGDLQDLLGGGFDVSNPRNRF